MITKDTPLPTPTHRYNAWADDRKSMGITPRPPGEGEGDQQEGVRFKNDQDRTDWEEEQKVGEHCVCVCECTLTSFMVEYANIGQLVEIGPRMV